MTLHRAALASLLAAACAAAQAQPLFKCVGRDGKVTYQGEKCADAVRESTVRPPDPVAPSGAPAAQPPPEAARGAPEPNEPPIPWEAFVARISSYENCAAVVPGFGPKHAASYQRWKERHRAAFARFNQDGDAQRRVRESTGYMRGKMNARSPEERQYDSEHCENTVAAAFAPPAPATVTPSKN